MRETPAMFRSARPARVSAVLVLLSLGVVSAGSATIAVRDLPPEEKAIANTADPWGLGFGDQVQKYVGYFEANTNAPYAVGVTHSLVKIWRNKYWFRGERVVLPAVPREIDPLWAVTGGTVSFQLAVLPRMGAAAATYQVRAKAPIPVRVYREEFLKLGPAAYPRFESEWWPDPLVPEAECSLAGTDAGVFLVELSIPAGFEQSSVRCEVEVSDGKVGNVNLTVKVEVVRLKLEPPSLHLVASFGKYDLGDEQFDGMCSLVLEHHLEPMIGGELKKKWDPDNPGKYEECIEFLMQKGQRIFDVASPDDALYARLVEKGWLSRFMTYCSPDEPSADVFRARNIPYAEKIRKAFPGLRLYLASELHPDMGQGCDICLTDLSSSQYDPRTFRPFDKLELWHYYCHLPINWRMRAPLTYAPNMEIDNAALEHRLALWMSRHYQAKGVYIWSGNREWKSLGTNFWASLDLSGDDYRKAYKYPYGGIHHGNGNLVYPPLAPGGPVVPSLRLKVLRDGMEDIAIFDSVVREFGERGESLVCPVPDVFQHPHYFDRLPESLLNKRRNILQKVRDYRKL